MRSSGGGFALLSAFLLLAVTLKPLGDPKRSLSGEPAKAQHVRRALVIGNQNYLHQALKNPIHDATDMAGALRTLGFKTDVLLDAAHAKMLTAIDAFADSLEQGDLGVFFYSGHGFQLDSNNYLEPIEFTARNEAEARQNAVSFDAVKGKLERTSADAIVMILDACRKNPFRPGGMPASGMAQMEAGLGSYLAFAASPGKTAKDNGSERNGLFTKYLLQDLNQPVGVAELFRRVRREVAEASNRDQMPYLHDQMITDLYLSSPQSQDASTSLRSPSEDEEKAKVLYHQGRCQEALDLLNHVVRTQPTNPFAQNSLGLAYACLSMNKPAAESFAMAIELKPDYAAAYVNRGNVFLNAGQYPLAIEDFTWAIEQEPTNASYYWHRGRALFGLRRYEDSQADFARAVELDPSDPHGHHGLGQISHQMGRFKEALDHYNAAILCKRDFTPAYVDRARARERLGDSAGAAADRQAAATMQR